MKNTTTFRIDKNLKEQFRSYCEKKDVSCSDMLRRLILMWIGNENNFVKGNGLYLDV
jgi:antitoxin component of RelBE/YafQ-DinJ toxin-antitoxin module